MQKYNILFFSLLLFCCACNSNRIPDNIIQPDRMTNLLTEIHIADGSMYNTMQIPDSLYKYGTAKYLLVFRTFHTDSLQFKKSMKYYSRKPDLLAKMYEQVATNLKQKSDSLNKVSQIQIAKDTKRREDSVKKLPKQPVQAKTADTVKAKLPAKPFNYKRFYPVKHRPNVDPIK